MISSTDQSCAEKYVRTRDALAVGLVKLVCDTGHPAVILPLAYYDDPVIALNFSQRFRNVAPPHLDDFGIGQNLSFHGQPFDVFVPWEAVVRLVQGETTYDWAPIVPDLEEDTLKQAAFREALAAGIAGVQAYRTTTWAEPGQVVVDTRGVQIRGKDIPWGAIKRIFSPRQGKAWQYAGAEPNATRTPRPPGAGPRPVFTVINGDAEHTTPTDRSVLHLVKGDAP